MTNFLNSLGLYFSILCLIKSLHNEHFKIALVFKKLLRTINTRYSNIFYIALMTIGRVIMISKKIIIIYISAIFI